ncbi:MAG TPA: type II toxin-antitoxin system death-on-curing family toxin [Chloroflexia bacterium]|nr:type II toxin-antitoxin system death-on-curing family toxin [Chloroflexia bacterium]
MDPIFLELDEVLELHRHQIRKYGGRPGVRDLSLLQSALEMPRSTFGGHFLHEDLFSMAAAYQLYITQNHPFIDGNKRVGLAATLLFLSYNGLKLFADKEALTELVLGVAEGKVEKAEIAEFLRKNSLKRKE